MNHTSIAVRVMAGGLAVAAIFLSTTWPQSAFAGEETPPVEDTVAPPTDTPVPPTDTPVPPTDTPIPSTDTPAPTETIVPTDTPAPTETGTPDATQTAIAEGGSDDGDGGSSPWLWIFLVLGALIVAGAAVGFYLSTRRRNASIDAAAVAQSRDSWLQSARMTYGKASSLQADLSAGAAARPDRPADDIEWLSKQVSRLDEVGFEVGVLVSSAPTATERTGAVALQTAIGEMRTVLAKRISPTGFATPAEYEAALSREVFELDAAVRGFQTIL